MSSLVYYDDSISMLERTAFKLLPILNEVCTKMVKYKDDKENVHYNNPASRVSQHATTISNNNGNSTDPMNGTD